MEAEVYPKGIVMLDLLEKRLAEAEFHYTRRDDGTLLWPFQGRYVLHPFIVAQESPRSLRALVKFPVPMVANVPELCLSLNEYLRRVEVSLSAELSDANRILELSMRIEDDEITESIEILAAFADDIHALFEHLRLAEYPLPRSWDEYLVGLAFLDCEDCEGGMH
jgi:hypothetical protein